MTHFEALIRINNPNPQARLAGKARYDVITARLPGHPWPQHPQRNSIFRVVKIPIVTDADREVARRLQAQVDMGVEKVFVSLPYKDEATKTWSTLRIDTSAVPSDRQLGRVIQPEDGYVRRAAELRSR